MSGGSSSRWSPSGPGRSADNAVWARALKTSAHQTVELRVGHPALDRRVGATLGQLLGGPPDQPVRGLGDGGAQADPRHAERGELRDRRRAGPDHHVQRRVDALDQGADRLRGRHPGHEDPAGAGREVALGPGQGLAEPVLLDAEPEQEHVDARVDEQRDPRLVGGPAGGGDARGELGRVARAVLDVDAD